MSWSACKKLMVIAVVAELLFTMFLEIAVIEPGMQGIGFMSLAGIVPITILTIFFLAAMLGPRGGSSSSDSNDVIQPWMKSNMYFNNQEMRRDVDRMAQLAEEHATRDRAN